MTTLAPNDFTHLHAHSEFSLLDGLGRITELVDAAAQLGMDSMAITDHGALYRAVTAAALQGTDNEQQVRQLDRQLHDLRRGITQQMEEARSELSFSRFNQGEWQSFVDLADQVRRRLTAMAEDSSLYVHARVQPRLVPSLPTAAIW